MSKRRKAQAVARKIHFFVNDIREKHHLPELTSDDDLISNAYAHSRDMSRNGYFSHKGSDGSSPQERCSSFRGVSENIYMTDTRGSSKKIAREAVDSWVDSSDHLENIMRKELRYDGVGVWIGDSIYITHDFAMSRGHLEFSLIDWLKR